MAAIIVTASILIKSIALIMILYTFLELSPKKEPKEVSMLSKYFSVKRKYVLLRLSLLFIAALIAIELLSMTNAVLSNPSGLEESQLLLSDVIFVGLIILLTKIYSLRNRFTREMDAALER